MHDTIHNTIPDWVEWIAQDYGGQWWGYEAEPNQYDKGWYENEVGRHIKLDKTAENPQWLSTLKRL